MVSLFSDAFFTLYMDNSSSPTLALQAWLQQCSVAFPQSMQMNILVPSPSKPGYQSHAQSCLCTSGHGQGTLGSEHRALGPAGLLLLVT